MQFSKKYFELKSQFNSVAEQITFSESGIRCQAFQYNSAYPADTLKALKNSDTGTNAIFALPDEDVKENLSFRYTVFTPGTRTKYQKAIILLHGLNERNWDKYLVWAYYLSKKTGHPVILFPIAFHMNRSPEAWGNPRIMQPLHNLRKQKYGNDPASTFANVALSERLTEEPLRFFTSGQQSAADIVNLCLKINLGDHPLFEKAATTNIFAYSIGAFLAQILFLANPDELFSNSKLFLFCGGAFFKDMSGVSKLIMDNIASKRLLSFYIDEINQENNGCCPLAHSMKKTTLGQAFLAMLAPEMMQPYREKRFREMSKMIQAITLKNDKVIPAVKIENALGKNTDIEILDFPYEYSHEAPFPLNNNSQFPLVDEAFTKIFVKATNFLR
jgi:pimeloyl-ACP methyl ester carboxylesterase